MPQYLSRVVIPFSEQFFAVDAPNMEEAITAIEARVALDSVDVRIVRELRFGDVEAWRLEDLAPGQVRQIFMPV